MTSLPRMGLSGLALCTLLLSALGPRPLWADDSAAPSDDLTESATSDVEDPGPGIVRILRLDDVVINRGSRDYFVENLELAAEDPETRAVVLVLDTPGGALQSTREMVKAMLGSRIPILVYVGPAGARAASAGTFITMAGHVAAMAPATNIGAAHPVVMSMPTKGGEDEKSDEAKDSQAAMLEKVTNDTVAFIRNIAEQRGRNADWAEKAVRESVSIQASEAVELQVVDTIAESVSALLDTVDGREIQLSEGRRIVLRTKGAHVEVPMTLPQRVLLFLTHPNVTYLLLALGAMGIWLEVNKPGLIVPGVVGVISLLLAAFGMSFIPVNALAVLFVILGLVAIIADIYVPSYGLLTAGGIAGLVFGGIFLVDKSPEFTVGVSPEVIILVGLLAVVLGLLVGWLVWRGERRKVVGGEEGMRGATGEVRAAIPGGRKPGRVFVHGELWNARAAVPIAEGEEIEVQAVNGLMLDVTRRIVSNPSDPPNNPAKDA